MRQNQHHYLMRAIHSKLFIISAFVAICTFFSSATALAASDEKGKSFDAAEMIMHHIQDSYEIHLWGEMGIPLPLIVFSADDGLSVFMSSQFDHGHKPYKGYYLDHGKLVRYDPNLSDEEIIALAQTEDYAGYSTEDWMGYFKGKQGAFIDLSITKNVFTLIFSSALVLLLFGAAARSYKKSISAPKGLTGFLEPLVLFVRDDIAIPNIGEKHYKRFLPFLLSVFFLIWINNLLGLVPIFAPNLSGNIAFTMVLALFTFFITTFVGNKNYWTHIFAPPVPKLLWIILVPIEIIGMFTKPFALMIRLFANITAGHILILSLVSLIFIFETVTMSLLSVPFMIFMLILELLVAALQAYIFTLLSALFIGMAVEEAHIQD